MALAYRLDAYVRLSGRDSSPLFSLHNSTFSLEQGLRPTDKINSCYTLGLYLRTREKERSGA